MGLTTFFQDADKGKAKFEELRKLSNETTFGVDELTDSFTQLANVGVQVDTIKDKMIMLGNVAQGDKNKFAELTSIYAKINSTGKAGALQLQQIASRGIPIYDMLKKIGVQGTASAEDITKAFQEMTKEGGQFYNAMNNINETIEGKRGFISDYFKEFTVNFAEVSGLADAYKAVLDKLKEAIGAVSDKLLEWNENPMAKALFSGAMVGIILGIGTAIVTSIIPALKKVIANLITMNLLQGPKGWAVLAVAGIGMAVTAYASYYKSTEEAIKETEKLAESAQKAKDALNYDNNLRANGIMTSSATRQSKFNSQQNFVKGLEEGLSKSAKEYVDALNELEEMESNAKTLGYTPELIEGYTELKQKVAELRKEEELRDKQTLKYVESQRQLLKTIQDEMSEYDKLNELKAKYDELGADTLGLSKEEQELKNLKDSLQTVLDYKAKLIELNGKYDNNGVLIRYDDDTRKQIDKTVDYFQKEIDKIELNLKIANQKDWQKALQDAFGFSNEMQGKLLDAWKNGTANGSAWVDAYIKDMKDRFDRIEKANKSYGVNGNDNPILKQAEEVFKAYNSLLEGAGDFDFDDNAIVSLMERINELRDEYVNAGGKLEDFNEALNNTTEVVQEEADSFKTWREILDENLRNAEKEAWTKSNYGGVAIAQIQSSAYNSIQGTDVGSFLEKLETTGQPLVALMEVIIDDLIKEIGGMDKVQYLLNIISNVLKAISPLLEAIMNVIAIISVILKPILDALNTFLKKLFKGWNDWFDDVYKKNEEQKEKQNDLTRSYEALLKAIKDQEEYYIRKKAELNMLGLADKVTKVNDMILTDKGVFSTSPQDTIMAMKNPSSLGGGVVNNIKVINNAGAQVDVQERKGNGMNEILVTISKKIASDVANGFNGWDSAFAMQRQRVDGRRI